MCSDDLLEDGFEVEIMWIPVQVGLEGNEIVDKRVRHAALNGAVFERPLPPVDFQSLAKSVLLREWDAADTAEIRSLHTPESFLDLGLTVKGGQEICFHCVENNVWLLYRPITLE
jgi:hypothetical protein